MRVFTVMFSMLAWMIPAASGGDDRVQKSFVVAEAGFELDAIRDKAKKELEEVRKKHKGARVIRLSFFTDPIDRSHYLSGKGRADYTFEQWRDDYDQWGKDLRSAAELYHLAGHTALRFRKAGKPAVVELLSRQAEGWIRPLTIEGPQGDFELLEVNFSSDSEFPAPLRVFAKFTPRQANVALDKRQAAWLAGHLDKHMHAGAIEVHVRRDTWFIFEPSFPVAYRFENDPGQPPSPDRYVRTCSYDSRFPLPGPKELEQLPRR